MAAWSGRPGALPRRAPSEPGRAYLNGSGSSKCGVSEPLIEGPTFSHQAGGLWRGRLVGARSEPRGVVVPVPPASVPAGDPLKSAPLPQRGHGGIGDRDGAHRLLARFCLTRSACACLSPAVSTGLTTRRPSSSSSVTCTGRCSRARGGRNQAVIHPSGPRCADRPGARSRPRQSDRGSRTMDC